MSDFKILIISEENQFWSQLLEDHATEIRTVRYQEIVSALNVAATYHLVIIDRDQTTRQLTLCRRLRSVFEGAILVFTGETDPYIHLRVYGAGADKCAIRPQSARLIRAMIRPWRRRLQRVA